MRRRSSVAANPVLIGAITVLITVVAVYLTYNANNGLPFVPSTRLQLELHDAVSLTKGNDVREGGYRIGQVTKLTPIRLADGRAGALVDLKLDRSAGRVPVDSVFAIRLVGAIGGKYVDLQRGSASRTYGDGDRVAVRHTRLPTELDDVLSAFDAPTRAGVRRTVRGLGDGLAGRGADLNAAIAQLPVLLGHLEPVMRTLGDPDTQLRRAIRAGATLSAELRGAAPAFAHVWGAAATTFGAMADRDPALRRVIRDTAPTLAAGERALKVARPLLREGADLMADVDALARTVRRTAPAIDRAVRRATPALAQVPRIEDELRGTFGELGRLAGADGTAVALRALHATERTLIPTLRFVGPSITVCNMANLWFTFVADVLTAPDRTGYAQRGLPQFSGPQDDGLGVMGANEFATGRNAAPGFTPQHLHADVFPAAVNADGSADCEVGQGGFVARGNPYDDTPDKFYASAVVKPASGNAGPGPLYKRFDRNGHGSGRGPERVPTGQTFTRSPTGRAAPEAP